jgi:hypothetical protein
LTDKERDRVLRELLAPTDPLWIHPLWIHVERYGRRVFYAARASAFEELQHDARFVHLFVRDMIENLRLRAAVERAHHGE